VLAAVAAVAAVVRSLNSSWREIGASGVTAAHGEALL
jgi:hypothetical protein